MDFLREISIPGVSSCYIGDIDKLFPGMKGYTCSVISDKSSYHSISCIRDYPEHQEEYEKTSLDNWQSELYQRATSLRICPKQSIDMSFGSKNQVPLDLWKYYEHGLGVVLNTSTSMMYLGIGHSTDYWKRRIGPESNLGLITFFSGSLDSPLEIFSEQEIHLGKGISILVEQGSALVETIQKELDAAYLRGALEQKLSIAMNFIGLEARPSRSENNLETLLKFNRIDIPDVFRDTWTRVEQELNFEDMVENVDEMKREFRRQFKMFPGQHLLFETFHHGDQRSRDEFLDQFINEALFFESHAIDGCEDGVLLLLMIPPQPEFGMSVLYVMFGVGCENITRSQKSVIEASIDALNRRLALEFSRE